MVYRQVDQTEDGRKETGETARFYIIDSSCMNYLKILFLSFKAF
jgi:hypothetical protein